MDAGRRIIPALVFLGVSASAGLVLVVTLFRSPGEDLLVETGVHPDPSPAVSAPSSRPDKEKDVRDPASRTSRPVPRPAPSETIRPFRRALEEGDVRGAEASLEAALEAGASPGNLAGTIVSSPLSVAEKRRLLERLLEAGRFSPKEVEALAVFFAWLGDQEKDLASCRRAFAMDPNLELAFRRFSESFPEAALRAVAVLDPERVDNPVVLDMILRFLAGKGRPELVEAFARRITDLYPDDKGEAFRILLGKDPQAICARLEDQAREAPRDADLWGNLGRARLATGRPRDAFDAFRKAIALDADSPFLPDLYQGLIASDPVQAETFFREKTRRTPSDPESWGKLGRALLASGRREAAFEALSKALALEPEDPEWMDLLLGIDARRTAALLRGLLEKNRYDDVLHGNLGRALLAAGDRAGAFEAYRNAFRVRRGGWYWARGMVEADPAEAEEVLEKHLRVTGDLPAGEDAGGGFGNAFLTPYDVAILGELGRACVLRGARSRGRDLLLEALDHLEGNLHLAPVYAGALGRVDPWKGRALLEDFASRAGHDDEIWGRIGQGYAEMGCRPEALAAYERARGLDPLDEEWVTAVEELRR